MKPYWLGEANPNQVNSIREMIKEIVNLVGDDAEREGLKQTPQRVFMSWKELYSGYKYNAQDVEDMLTQFDGEQYDGFVLLKDVEFYSMCEHHMLPFIGKAHIGYIPDKKIVGVSKLARLLEVFSRRLTIQERIGEQVVDTLMNVLQAKGAGCILEAKHLCIACRGVQKQHSVMVTSSLRGCVKEDINCRQEFMQLIKGGTNG